MVSIITAGRGRQISIISITTHIRRAGRRLLYSRDGIIKMPIIRSNAPITIGNQVIHVMTGHATSSLQ